MLHSSVAAETLLNAAIHAYKQKEYSKAVQLLTSALDSDPNNPDILVYLTVLAPSPISTAPKATLAFRRSITKHKLGEPIAKVLRPYIASTKPEKCWNELTLLAFLIADGQVKAQASDFPRGAMPANRFTQAANLYRRALLANPNNVLALNGLAALLEHGHVKAHGGDFPGTAVMPTDRFAQAANLYRRALWINPNDADALTHLALLIKQKRVKATATDFLGTMPTTSLEQATKLYVHALQTNRNGTFAWDNSADVLELLESASKSDPDNFDILVYLTVLTHLQKGINLIPTISANLNTYTLFRRNIATHKLGEPIAKLLRHYIASAKPEKTWNELGLLAALIISGQVKAQASDFYPGTMPAERFEQAAALCRRVLLINPNALFTLQNLIQLIRGGLKAQPGDFPGIDMPTDTQAQIRTLYQRILNINPDFTPTLYELAGRAFYNGKTAETASLLRQALLTNPNEFRALHKLAKLIYHGYVKAKAEDFPGIPMPVDHLTQAMTLLDRALQVAPHNETILKFYRFLHRQAKQKVEAGMLPASSLTGNHVAKQQATLLRHTLLKDPNDTHALYNLARLISGNKIKAQAADFPNITFLTDRFEQAATLLRYALLTNPNNSPALSALAHFICTSKVKARPGDFPGTVSMPANHFEQAAILFRRALKIDPKNTHSLSWLAMLLHEGKITVDQSDFLCPPTDRFEQAATLLRRVLLIEPSNCSAPTKLEMVLASKKQAQERLRLQTPKAPPHSHGSMFSPTPEARDNSSSSYSGVFWAGLSPSSEDEDLCSSSESSTSSPRQDSLPK